MWAIWVYTADSLHIFPSLLFCKSTETESLCLTLGPSVCRYMEICICVAERIHQYESFIPLDLACLLMQFGYLEKSKMQWLLMSLHGSTKILQGHAAVFSVWGASDTQTRSWLQSQLRWFTSLLLVGMWFHFSIIFLRIHRNLKVNMKFLLEKMHRLCALLTVLSRRVLVVVS